MTLSKEERSALALNASPGLMPAAAPSWHDVLDSLCEMVGQFATFNGGQWDGELNDRALSAAEGAIWVLEHAGLVKDRRIDWDKLYAGEYRVGKPAPDEVQARWRFVALAVASCDYDQALELAEDALVELVALKRAKAGPCEHDWEVSGDGRLAICRKCGESNEG